MTNRSYVVTGGGRGIGKAVGATVPVDGGRSVLARDPEAYELDE